MSRRVAIVSGSRIPFAKSFTSYFGLKGQDIMEASLKDLVTKMKLQNEKVDDVALGAVIMHGSDWDLAREAVLGSGLPATTPAYDIRRACGTSLETVVAISNKILAGQADVGIAGGLDTNSDAPIEFQRSFALKMMMLNGAKTFGAKLGGILKFKFNDLKPHVPGVTEPRTGLSMGEHCELMAKEWEIKREDQDQLAYESHQKAAKAYNEGFYDDLVSTYKKNSKDKILRPQTSLEKLATLKPVFDRKNGTLTAGNSTALTDGSSCVLLAEEEYAKKKGWPVLAYFKDAQVSGVDFLSKNGKAGEGLLMAPTVAVSELLKRNNLTFDDFDYFEIHEAFAAQVLCTLKAWEDPKYCKERLGRDTPLGSIDRTKLNVKGGSLALGHPFGATGARITATLAKILSEKKSGRGLISICTGGGMGVAAIVEAE